MATVGDVREALAAAVQGVGGLRAFPRYPGTVTPPAAVIRRLRTHRATELDGSHTVVMGVSVYLPIGGGGAAAVDVLDDLVDPGGPIYAAVLTDVTLGGVVRRVLPDPNADVEEEALVTLSDIEVLAATVPFTIVFK